MLCGPAAEEDPSVYDLGVLSPGSIPSCRWPRISRRKNIQTIGELELGWQFVPRAGHRHHRHQRQDDDDGVDRADVECLRPAHDRLRQHRQAARAKSRARSEDLVVLTVEVSSFQLETIRDFHPEISVWLNFAPDHLDRYPSIREYRAAKLRIFENQTADDTAIVNVAEDLPAIAGAGHHFQRLDERRRLFVRRRLDRLSGSSRFCELAEAQLRGPHNAENMMAALAVGRARGLSFEEMVPPLCAYRAQLHRLRIHPRDRRRRLHQRLEGDQSRCAREGAAQRRPNRSCSSRVERTKASLSIHRAARRAKSARAPF